jgi:hypothetical protein
MARKGKKTNININATENKCSGKSKSCGGFGYFLGFLGAAIYYVSVAEGFWGVVLGLLKASVWPAFLIFELLKYIGA